MKNKFGVAIIGCGYISRFHVSAWASLPNTQLLAVVDSNLTKTKEYIKKYKVKAYDDYMFVLKDRNIDIVDVCVPTFLHKQIVVDAVKERKHILCEKPIALNLKDANTMIEAVKKTRMKFMVGHCVRFFPEYSKIKQLIQHGEIGRPITAKLSRVGPMPKWASWYSEEHKSGGVILDFAIHDIDFIRWCFDHKVKYVFAETYSKGTSRAKTRESVNIVLTFKHGGLAFIESAYVDSRNFPFSSSCEIHGVKGILSTDNKIVRKTSFIDGKTSYFYPLWDYGYFLEIKHFVDSILKNKDPIVSGEEARNSLAVALAAIESSHFKKPIFLNHK